MSPRELIILLLGLAIVAVILRGLYVAIQARRGQIRLAIDKNIPKDVNLDELELSELPSGGARVVARPGSSDPALDHARARAETMDLGEAQEEQIPVLMEAVEVSAGDDGDELDEDANDILLDYQETDYGMDADTADDTADDTGPSVDNLSSVAPDYDEPESEPVAAEQDELVDLAVADGGEEDWDDADTGGELAVSDDADPREPPGEPGASFEDSLGRFSMSAGERIGHEGTGSKQARQTSLFADADEEADPVAKAPRKRQSLLAALSRLTAGRRRAPAESVAAENAGSAECGEGIEGIESTESTESVESAEDSNAEAAASETAAVSEPQPVTTTPAAEPDSWRRQPAASESPTATGNGPQPSEVLVINLMARHGRQFRGDDLLEALITSGLKFGEMNIFHRRTGAEGKGPAIFSVANMLNPGTFDLNKIDQFTTVGISLFLALPAPINNLDAFTQMLNTAGQIQAQLNAELKDDNRNIMTAQTIEHYRQRVRDFELRQLKAAGSRA